METQKYLIGEYVYVKCGFDDIRLGLVKSYADGLYRIETEKGFVLLREENIAHERNKFLEILVEKMNKYERDILKFDKNNDFVLREPTQEGYYVTIRVGHNGIYTSVNYWKDGNWLGHIADGSHIVARSSKQINIESD